MWCLYPFLEVNAHDQDLYTFAFKHYYQELSNVLETFNNSLRDHQLPENLADFRSLIRRGFVLEFLIVTVLRPVLSITCSDVVLNWHKKLLRHEKRKAKGGLYRLFAGQPPKLPPQDQVFQNPRYLEFLQFYFKIATSLGAFEELGLIYFELMKDAMFGEGKLDGFESDLPPKKAKIFSQEWFRTVLFGSCMKPLNEDQNASTKPTTKTEKTIMPREDMIYADEEEIVKEDVLMGDVSKAKNKTPNNPVESLYEPVSKAPEKSEEETLRQHAPSPPPPLPEESLRTPTPDPLRTLAAQLHASFIDYRETFAEFKDLMDKNVPETPMTEADEQAVNDMFENNVCIPRQQINDNILLDVAEPQFDNRQQQNVTNPVMDSSETSTHEGIKKERTRRKDENLSPKEMESKTSSITRASCTVDKVTTSEPPMCHDSTCIQEDKQAHLLGSLGKRARANFNPVSETRQQLEESNDSEKVVETSQVEASSSMGSHQMLNTVSKAEKSHTVKAQNVISLSSCTAESLFQNVQHQTEATATIQQRKEQRIADTMECRKDSFCSDVSKQDLMDILDQDEASWADTDEKVEVNLNSKLQTSETIHLTESLHYELESLKQDGENKVSVNEQTQHQSEKPEAISTSADKQSIMAWLQLAKPNAEHLEEQSHVIIEESLRLPGHSVESCDDSLDKPPKSLFELLCEADAEDGTEVRGLVEENPTENKEPNGISGKFFPYGDLDATYKPFGDVRPDSVTLIEDIFGPIALDHILPSLSRPTPFHHSKGSDVQSKVQSFSSTRDLYSLPPSESQTETSFQRNQVQSLTEDTSNLLGGELKDMSSSSHSTFLINVKTDETGQQQSTAKSPAKLKRNSVTFKMPELVDSETFAQAEQPEKIFEYIAENIDAGPGTALLHINAPGRLTSGLSQSTEEIKSELFYVCTCKLVRQRSFIN